ncbi:nucleotide exchange factor GrpE [bacterium]|nr:nucleotide exchange factor GrpE [bacterium]
MTGARSDDSSAEDALSEAVAEALEVVEAELVEDGDVLETPGVIDLPDDPEQAIVALVDALGVARASADSYLDDLQRLGADFENFRKRTIRDRDEIVERSAQRLVVALLPVLDSFEQALGQDAVTENEQNLLNGMNSTFQQLMEVLVSEGVERMTGQGEPFDPNIHEAVGGVTGDDLIVDRVFRTGYVMKGRVLRPTMVLVAPAETPEQEG